MRMTSSASGSCAQPEPRPTGSLGSCGRRAATCMSRQSPDGLYRPMQLPGDSVGLNRTRARGTLTNGSVDFARAAPVSETTDSETTHAERAAGPSKRSELVSTINVALVRARRVVRRYAPWGRCSATRGPGPSCERTDRPPQPLTAGFRSVVPHGPIRSCAARCRRVELAATKALSAVPPSAAPAAIADATHSDIWQMVAPAPGRVLPSVTIGVRQALRLSAR
jgi:hypothetical protein